MNFSTRGAARVSIVWIIAVGVLFLVSMVFAFVAQSDLKQAEDKLAEAQAKESAAIATTTEERDMRRGISTAVGWYDRESAIPSSNTEVIGTALSDLRTTFGLEEAATADLETALPFAVAAYQARGREIQNLKSQIENLQGELDTAKSSERQSISDKDQALSAARQEKADEIAAAEGRIADLERRVAQLGQQNSELDLELRSEREKRDEAMRLGQQDRNALAARVAELGKLAAFAKHDRAQEPDGEILAVSTSLPVAFINRGSRHRLALGTRFRIQSGTLGDRTLKAMGEVIDIEAEKASIRIGELVDEFNPVVPGDVIINPLYDPEGTRNAILVGRFDATYSEKELRLLLADIGINLQPRLDKTTHYLIVGAELWTDEDGEPLDEPLQPSELPVYSDAEAQGVQIVPLQNVREFFTLRRES